MLQHVRAVSTTSTTWQVLIAEHDPALASLHRRAVAAVDGLEVAGVVTRGQDALAFMQRYHCDLLLLDLRLAGMNGAQLLRQIRSSGNPVEVIVVTASRSATTVRSVLHHGVVDYLVKPVSVDRLRLALGLFMDRVSAFHDDVLDQDAIDRVCSSGRSLGRWMPKGLTEEGILRVQAALESHPGPLSSSDVAERIGMARVTVRRYLEYLVTTDQASVQATPTGPGRPRKLYRAMSA